MSPSSCLVAAACLLVALPIGVAAQTAKPPPRLPPPPSQTSQIPSGVDTGTPATSDSLPLGTPVMSQAAGGPSGGRGTSAAARAAARPKPVASSADCTRPLPAPTADKEPPPLPKPSVTGKSKPPPTKPPVAPGATRIDC